MTQKKKLLGEWACEQIILQTADLGQISKQCLNASAGMLCFNFHSVKKNFPCDLFFDP